MSCSEKYIPKFHALEYRMTPQRLAILHVLQDADRHVTPAQVFERASKMVKGLTEPTVYRTLDFLAQNGFIQPAHLGGGRLVYELAQHQHHHLKCRGCGAEMKIEHTVLKAAFEKLESITGYQLMESHLIFWGSCPDCQKGE